MRDTISHDICRSAPEGNYILCMNYCPKLGSQGEGTIYITPRGADYTYLMRIKFRGIMKLTVIFARLSH